MLALRLPITALSLLVLASAAAAAPRQGPCVEVTPQLRERPDPEGTPTRVGMSVYLIDLYAIDDVSQTFQADFILTMTWRDARLAAGMATDAKNSCSYDVDAVWTPEPLLLNTRGADIEGIEQVLVQPEGTCTFARRYMGTFSFKSDLSDFPLDHQYVSVGVVVPPRVGEVELVHEEARCGIWEDVSIPNWELRDLDGRTYDRYLPQLEAEVHVFEIGLWVQRHITYYVWKLIVPLIIVVMMSWSVFWISPKAALQLGLGATAVLTLIAYRFATATLLPPIGYLTRLDLFLTGSSVLVLLALVEALVTVNLGDKGRVEAALKIDRICRVVIPALFASLIVWSFLL